MRSKAAKPAARSGVNPLEGIREFGHAVSTEVTDDLIKGGANDFMKQLLGIDVAATMKPVNKENKTESLPAVPGGGPVEIFNAKNHQGESYAAPKPAEKPKKPEARKEAAINYASEVVRGGEKAIQVQKKDINERIHEIKGQLEQEVLTSPKLKAKFTEVGVDHAPVHGGHIPYKLFGIHA